MPQNDVLKMLLDNEERLKQTETRETPGNITGFTSFYAFGTWSPTLVGAGTAGTFTYDATNTGGRYTRIGNRVFVSGRIRITAIGVAPVGNMTINGLPITSATSGYASAGGVSFNYWRGITMPAGFTQANGNINDAVTTIEMYRCGSAATNTIVLGADIALVGGAITFAFEGMYHV